MPQFIIDDEDVKKAIFEMSEFDSHYSRDRRALERFRRYLLDFVRDLSVAHCLTQSFNSHDEVENSRGYVRGIAEVASEVNRVIEECIQEKLDASLPKREVIGLGV